MANPIIYGAVGGALILGAYLVELFGHISAENKWFLSANLAGSILLFVYAWMLKSPVFMITNAVWALGSIYELVVCSRND
jgi:lipid-A-disaccharide synthase-like uncharacterized protein